MKCIFKHARFWLSNSRLIPSSINGISSYYKYNYSFQHHTFFNLLASLTRPMNYVYCFIYSIFFKSFHYFMAWFNNVYYLHWRVISYICLFCCLNSKYNHWRTYNPIINNIVFLLTIFVFYAKYSKKTKIHFFYQQFPNNKSFQPQLFFSYYYCFNSISCFDLYCKIV